MILFGGETMAWLVRPPFRPELVLAQMAAIGVGSTFIVATTGFFVGMVFALQVTYAMGQFGAEGYVGGSVALALARELAPVLTSLMVIGRSGSAIATEIGTMRVTEQIDAMETMAVNPVQYLAVPRFIAALVMFPVLTMLFNGVGYMGGYLMGIFVSDIPPGPFIEHTRTMVEPQDVVHGLFKAGDHGRRGGDHHLLPRLQHPARRRLARRGRGHDARGGDELHRHPHRRLRADARRGGEVTP